MKRVILFDATRLLARHNAPTPTGIDRVDLNYALHISEQAQARRCRAVYTYQKDGRFHVMESAKAQSFFSLLRYRWLDTQSGRRSSGDLSEFYRVTLGANAPPPGPLPKGLMRGAPKKILSLGQTRLGSVDAPLLQLLLTMRGCNVFYLNCSHHGVGAVDAYYVMKTVAGAKLVFFLHDLIPVDFPEYVRPGDEMTHAGRVTAMAAFGDLVIVNSKYTAHRFSVFCRERGLHEPEVRRNHIGCEERFFESLKQDSAGKGGQLDRAALGRYFITIGTIEPRKNHGFLFQLWRRLKHELGENCPKLVVVGKRGWQNEETLRMLERCPALQRTLIEMSDVGDAHLVHLLRGARALLYPSFTEGWGMPLVEAMAAGVPAVCADIPAFREAGQGCAAYLDLLDGTGWRDLVAELSLNDEIRAGLVARAREFQPPTWEAHFVRFDEMLKEFTGAVVVREESRARWEAMVAAEHHLERFALRTATGVLPVQASVLDWFDRLAATLLNERQQRKYRKLRTSPARFFADSRNPLLNILGFASPSAR